MFVAKIISKNSVTNVKYVILIDAWIVMMLKKLFEIKIFYYLLFVFEISVEIFMKKHLNVFVHKIKLILFDYFFFFIFDNNL